MKKKLEAVWEYQYGRKYVISAIIIWLEKSNPKYETVR